MRLTITRNADDDFTIQIDGAKIENVKYIDLLAFLDRYMK